MKFSSLYQYDILCEDEQTKMFVKGILRDQKINIHRLHFITASSGLGSAEAFVRKEYPKRLQAIRQFNYNRRGLIVCVDADKNDVAERKKQLVSACQDRTPVVKGRQPTEAVIVWVPKRNIETWIRFFRDAGYDLTVDEITDYKTGDRVPCKEESKRMSVFLQTEDQRNVLPSLEDAKEEYRTACKIMQKQDLHS